MFKQVMNLINSPQMPRIWLDYCQFLMDQYKITRTRRTFDRALRALPLTQHKRIWPLYLKFIRSHDLPETAVRVYRRFLKVRTPMQHGKSHDDENMHGLLCWHVTVQWKPSMWIWLGPSVLNHDNIGWGIQLSTCSIQLEQVIGCPLRAMQDLRRKYY